MMVLSVPLRPLFEYPDEGGPSPQSHLDLYARAVSEPEQAASWTCWSILPQFTVNLKGARSNVLRVVRHLKGAAKGALNR